MCLQHQRFQAHALRLLSYTQELVDMTDRGGSEQMRGSRTNGLLAAPTVKAVLPVGCVGPSNAKELVDDITRPGRPSSL